MPQMKPMERTQFFTLPANKASYIDSGFTLSYMNRTAFRQGMEYAIQQVEVFGTPNVDVSVDVETLSQNWVAANSWVKGFSHWRAQQEEFLEAAGQQSRKAKYNDFKIFYDSDHSNVDNLLPDNTITEAEAQVIDPTAQSEWDYSQVVVPYDDSVAPPAAVEYFLMMIGDDSSTRKSLIHNYALSRRRPPVFDPNQVSPASAGGLYQEMVDVGEILEDVGANVSTNNFVPPYLIADADSGVVGGEFYPGGKNNPLAGSTKRDILTIRGGTGAFNSDSTGPFTALCGLIKLTNNSETETCTVRVTWAPGPYKGVMARSMQEVN